MLIGRGLSGSSRWVHTWTAMPQLTEPDNLPPAPFTGPGSVLADTTLRQTLRITAGGRRLRVRLSNTFGGADLPITAAAVARPAGGAIGVAGIRPGTSCPLLFGGNPAVTIPPGAQIVSDPVDVAVAAGAALTVSVYLADGQQGLALTSHPGSRTTSWLIAGDHHTAVNPVGATAVDHWYLISGVEVQAGAPGLALLGDSLTDGRGSTTNGHDRWPDQLFDRLRDTGIAVLNQAAGGNRVLRDGLGPSALARLDRDVLAVSGVRWMLVFTGVNDIGTAPADEPSQRQVVPDLLGAYRQMVVRGHASDIAVYGATLTPFGGNIYDDPGRLRERSRQAVNTAIRGGIFDAAVDFDAAVRDPGTPDRLAARFDAGDHLHLNPAGYATLAATVPRRLLQV
ncbi:SGNH/GDSL hydrolase family protein [Actinoplanes sp. NBRC 101535]|uniref:SGNH/GDSL hydrolase family protein n=1 Tax=Actinoplanes sp. NBRC 101535 TaxID=3032196 RepID=UPI0024A2F993|nr:SGNH/GDSL hydrolase family protein [Actinoplanes sp. NBRC 101535]GLY00382.1 SGNH hydrolase [Actinoplanes sp. NBRC 101535]